MGRCVWRAGLCVLLSQERTIRGARRASPEQLLTIVCVCRLADVVEIGTPPTSSVCVGGGDDRDGDSAGSERACLPARECDCCVCGGDERVQGDSFELWLFAPASVEKACSEYQGPLYAAARVLHSNTAHASTHSLGWSFRFRNAFRVSMLFALTVFISLRLRMHGSASLFVFTGSECTHTSVAPFIRFPIIVADCGKGDE